MKFLFDVYKKEHGPRFGSRFMKALGNLFMGTPESKGLGDVRQDLRDTYYWEKTDRVIPVDELEEWMEQSVLVNQYRQIETPAAAKATSLVLAVASIALVVAGAQVSHAREAQKVVGAMSIISCEAFQASVFLGHDLPDQQAKFQSRIAGVCKDKLADAAKALTASMDDNACQQFVEKRDGNMLSPKHAAHGVVLSKHCRPAVEARGAELVKEMDADTCRQVLPLFEADEAPNHLAPYQDQLAKACKSILKK